MPSHNHPSLMLRTYNIVRCVYALRFQSILLVFNWKFRSGRAFESTAARRRRRIIRIHGKIQFVQITYIER